MRARRHQRRHKAVQQSEELAANENDTTTSGQDTAEVEMPEDERKADASQTSSQSKAASTVQRHFRGFRTRKLVGLKPRDLLKMGIRDRLEPPK